MPATEKIGSDCRQLTVILAANCFTGLSLDQAVTAKLRSTFLNRSLAKLITTDQLITLSLKRCHVVTNRAKASFSATRNAMQAVEKQGITAGTGEGIHRKSVNSKMDVKF
ncbi:MAG: hypothetical protein R3C11_17780 [Planctomycetaceae bacterium]